MEHVDLVIIGSGQGAVPLAKTFAEQGKRVVVFERERAGGTCVNWGCTPTKAFLGAAHAAGRAAQSAPLGIHCDVRVDFAEVMERVRAIRDRFTRGVEKTLSEAGVELVQAEARLADDGGVEGGGRHVHAPTIVIDTGSRAAEPPVEGLSGIDYLTDRSVWDLTECPPRLAVIGGGYIGLEMAQGFARLGAAVEVFEHGDRILATEAAQVSDALREAFVRDGIELHEGISLERVDYAQGRYTLQAGSQRFEADALLVAAGRRPNTDALVSGGTKLALDERGFVKINPQFQTNLRGVYAIGEAAGQPAFTHVAWEDYRRLVDVLAGGGRRRDDRVLGYTVFTEPQVARVGLSLEQARREGYPVRHAEMAIRNMARGQEWGHDIGFHRIIADAQTRRLLGAEMVGYETGELVHVVLALIESGVTVDELGKWQHIHPTYAENLPTLARMIGE